MKISDRNLRILLFTNILRFILSLYVIFKTKLNYILKCYLLFFSGGIDDLDSLYPTLFNLFKTEKNNKSSLNIFGPSKNSNIFGDYYNIPDKVNDLISNWSFLIYLRRNKILDDFDINLLKAVLFSRSYGLFLYFLKNTKILRKLNIDKKIFFYFPDLFSIFSLYLLVLKKYNKKRKTGMLVILFLLKLTHEYYLHVN